MAETRKPRENVRLPALSGLLAFEAVARHASFSKAADELSVTQSAVSHRIAQLESRLGVSLLLRVGHLVSLTSHGGDLLPHVREGLDCLRHGVGKVAGLSLIHIYPKETAWVKKPNASNWAA